MTTAHLGPDQTMPPSHPIDLPLVAKELRLTFDVVERASGKARRVTLLATVGVPFDEDGLAVDDGAFAVHDFEGHSRLTYVRSGDATYVRRLGLDRWQKRTAGLESELDLLHGASECSYVMQRTPLHGVTGRPVTSWSTAVEGRVDDPALDRVFDTSAIPGRLRMLRETVAAGVLLTREGLAYRQPYPSWKVEADGGVVALTRPSRCDRSSSMFGLGRLDDALVMARRLGGDPQVRGAVERAPAGRSPDRSTIDAAVSVAELLTASLSRDLPDMPGESARLWHDCANAQSIVDEEGDDGAVRIMTSARDLARAEASGPGLAKCWRWGPREEARIALEVGRSEVHRLRTGPMP